MDFAYASFFNMQNFNIVSSYNVAEPEPFLSHKESQIVCGTEILLGAVTGAA
jgi:hypothetical protein